MEDRAVVANNGWLGQSFPGEAALVWQLVLKLEQAFVPVRALTVAVTAVVWLSRAPVPGSHPAWADAVLVAACLYIGLGFLLLRRSHEFAARVWPLFPGLDLLLIFGTVATTGWGQSPFLMLIFLGAAASPGILPLPLGLAFAVIYGALWTAVALPDQRFMALYVLLIAVLHIAWGHIIRADRYDHVRDPLTGCFGRGHALHEIERLIAQAVPFAVVLLDLDGFKQINDRHGHPAGDAVLQAAASHIARHAGDGDILARLGGDEFLLVMPGADTAAAEAAAERIRSAFAATRFTIAGTQDAARLTLSAGVAAGTTEGGVAGILEQADLLLYRAKRTHNRVAAAADAH